MLNKYYKRLLKKNYISIFSENNSLSDRSERDFFEKNLLY